MNIIPDIRKIRLVIPWKALSSRQNNRELDLLYLEHLNFVIGWWLAEQKNFERSFSRNQFNFSDKMILENFIYLRMKFYNEFYKRMLNFIKIQLDQNEKWNLYLVMEVNHEIPWYGLATISTLIVFPAKDKNFNPELLEYQLIK